MNKDCLANQSNLNEIKRSQKDYFILFSKQSIGGREYISYILCLTNYNSSLLVTQVLYKYFILRYLYEILINKCIFDRIALD